MLNPFRKKTDAPAQRATDRKSAPLTSDPAVSPFFADHTRGGLTDRFAELDRRRSDWVLVAGGLLMCLLVSLGMNAYQAVRTTLIPFKVVVDGHDGYLLDAGTIEPMTSVEDVYIYREIISILRGLRTATGDLAATRADFMDAYGHLDSSSENYEAMQALFQEPGNNPMQITGTGQRTITNILGPTRGAGTDTWQVGWTERTFVAGQGTVESTYNSTMTIEIRQPREQEALLKNPLGVWVTGLRIQRLSSKQLTGEELEGRSPLELLYPDQAGIARAAARVDSVAAIVQADSAARATPPAP